MTDGTGVSNEPITLRKTSCFVTIKECSIIH